MSGVPSNFESFWSEWPNNGSRGFEDYTRKKDRKKCCEKFERLSEENQLAALRDVQNRSKYDKAWKAQRGKFLSSPEVYLNNHRWGDGAYADIRDDRKNGEAKSNAPDLNKVCEWIKDNKKLTEKQLTSQWFWLSDGTRVVGVRIPDMPDLMFKSFTQATQ